MHARRQARKAQQRSKRMWNQLVANADQEKDIEKGNQRELRQLDSKRRQALQRRQQQQQAMRGMPLPSPRARNRVMGPDEASSPASVQQTSGRRAWRQRLGAGKRLPPTGGTSPVSPVVQASVGATRVTGRVAPTAGGSPTGSSGRSAANAVANDTQGVAAAVARGSSQLSPTGDHRFRGAGESTDISFLSEETKAPVGAIPASLVPRRQWVVERCVLGAHPNQVVSLCWLTLSGLCVCVVSPPLQLQPPRTIG